MAITYDGGTGLFDILGTLAGGTKDMTKLMTSLNTRRATLAGDATAANNPFVQEAYTAFDMNEAMTPLQLRKVMEAADRVLIETLHAEDPLQTLTVSDALQRLDEEMLSDGKDFNDSAVGTSSANSGTGTGALVVGLNHPKMDRELQAIRAESLIARCVVDAQGNGGTIEGEEVFTLKGEAAVDRTDRRWPGGSGINSSIACTHGGQDQFTRPGANMLLNSDLEDWTGNVPDNWTLKTGSGGTQLLQEQSDHMRGSSGGELAGHATLVHLRQPLDGIKGMKLKPQTPYCLSIWMKRDGSAAGDGAAILALTASDSTTEMTDENSADIKVSIDLTALTTSYVNYGGIFWTPKNVDATPDIALIVTDALTSGRSVFFDEITLSEAVVPHAAGPQLCLVAGGTDYVFGDTATATLTNNRAATQWVYQMDFLFDLYGLSEQRRGALPLGQAILFPRTTGSGDINDNLINSSL